MMMLLSIIILFSLIQLSTETNYSCNSTASCGCSINSTVVSRIVNGEPAQTGAWGWAVSLKLGPFMCGGSIVSRSWIITAAHCVEGITASQVTVYAGSNILWSSNQTRHALYIVAHPNYNSTTFTNDIALIKLAYPLVMNDRSIHAICLPSVNSTILGTGEWPIANTTVVAVGWGRLSENGSISSTLQQVTLAIIDHQTSTCSPLINDYRLQLCASVADGSKDTCQGDSGGPLMMFSSNNQWILIGLTSYGEGCAQPGYAGVYTRVAAFQDWINSTMNTACIQTPSLCYISFIILLLLLSYLKEERKSLE